MQLTDQPTDQRIWKSSIARRRPETRVQLSKAGAQLRRICGHCATSDSVITRRSSGQPVECAVQSEPAQTFQRSWVFMNAFFACLYFQSALPCDLTRPPSFNSPCLCCPSLPGCQPATLQKSLSREQLHLPLIVLTSFPILYSLVKIIQS